MHYDGKNATGNYKIAHTSLLISSFGEDEAGELYFTAFDGGFHQFKTPANDTYQAFPRTLTETGLFTSVKEHQVASGLIPYDVNVQLWSDGAIKERFLALPRNDLRCSTQIQSRCEALDRSRQAAAFSALPAYGVASS